MPSFNTMTVSLFCKLILAFAVILPLLSELTAKEATARVAAVFKLWAETSKEEGYVADLSICDASLPIDSLASNCVDNTSLRVTAIAFYTKSSKDTSDEGLN